MTTPYEYQLLQLQTDVERFAAAIRRQIAEDPDHVVALAMLQADHRRAHYLLSAHQASRRAPETRWQPARKETAA